MKRTKRDIDAIVAENRALHERLQNAEETLRAVQRGEVDGIVISTPEGEQLFTLSGVEKPYRLLIEEMKEGAVMLSDNNTILYCNSGFADIIKQPLDKIIGINIQKIISPTHNSVFAELMSFGRKGKGSKAGEVSLQTADKTTVPAHMSVNSFQKDDVKTTFLVFTDLTQHMQEDVKRYTAGLELEIRRRKEAEQALKDSERKFRTLSENAPDPIMRFDPDLRVIYLNAADLAVTGRTLEEFLGKTNEEIGMPAELCKLWNNTFDKAKTSRQVQEVEFDFLSIAGSRTFNLRVVPEFAEDGSLVSYIGISRDVTERKKAEEALQESEQNYRELTDRIKEVFFAFDKDLKYTYWNKASEILTGIAAKDAIGKHIYEIFPKDEQTKSAAVIYKKALETNRPQFFKNKYVLSGNEFYFEIAAFPSEKGLSVFARDITKRKEAEEALKRLNQDLEERVRRRTEQLSAERQRLYNVLETLPAYVILLDKDHYVSFANKIFRERFGESHDQRCHEYLFNLDSECANCETYKVYRENKPQNWYWTGPDGRDYDIYDFPFVEADGSTLILEMGIDITERRKLEKQLKDSERMIAIGQTAGMVGHDIRNPLQAMASDVYLARDDLKSVPDGDAKESISESLDGIQKNIEYVNKIVQDLQDYARPLAPAAKEVDLESICEEILFKNSVPENVEASCKFTDEARTVTSDADLLKRVLSNLVSNAVQAMPDGGKLTILAYQDKKTAEIVIDVVDSGCGIPESVKPSLFTPMFTTKSKGQGFGLAVVKRITESMGGTISYESMVDKGTTFRVRLPPKK